MILISQSTLGELLWRSFLYGLFFGLVYDILHSIVMASRTPNCEICGVKMRLWRVGEITLASILDFVFCMVVALVSILLMYRVSGGVFRGMVYGGMAVGFLIFRLTFSKILRKPFELLSKLIRFAAGKMLLLIFLPARGVICLIILIYRLTIGKIRVKIKEDKNKLDEEHQVLQEQSMLTPPSGEGEFLNAEKKASYQRDGRISFGTRGQ